MCVKKKRATASTIMLRNETKYFVESVETCKIRAHVSHIYLFIFNLFSKINSVSHVRLTLLQFLNY